MISLKIIINLIAFGTKLIFSMIIFRLSNLNFTRKLQKNSIVFLFVLVKYLFFLFNGLVQKISSGKFKNKSSLVQNTLV